MQTDQVRTSTKSTVSCHIKALLTQRIRLPLYIWTCKAGRNQAASRPEFGDYQANGVMCGQTPGLNPRDVAADVIAKLSGDADFAAMVSVMELAGLALSTSRSPSFVAPSLATAIDTCATAQPWWSIIPRPIWQKKCTSATCAQPLLVTVLFEY